MDVSPEDDWKLTMDANEKRNRFTSCVLRTQATCLAWSSAFSHSINSGNHSHDFYDVDFPLLAIGHRRGDISLWRHTSNGQMELESLNPVCPNGHTINLLSWSNWKLSARPRVDLASATQYQLTAYLAVANSKGVVYLLKIYRPFERPTKPLLPTSHIKIETVGVYQDPLNQSSITYLKWLPSIGNTVRYHYRSNQTLYSVLQVKTAHQLISAYLSSTISVIRISFQSLGGDCPASATLDS
ncbi:hypothetical protein Pst134EB_021936 [Puccinia striiformis f. sp. tritici]|nr:hypothetical protein Pst134EB_021936 [Puccinia striiformis f. sp. tritici]